MSFNEENLSRMGPATPDNQTTVRLVITGDRAERFERRPWREVGSTIHGGIFLPLSSLVANGTIEDFLLVLADHCCTDKGLRPNVYEIIGAQGRTVEVTAREWGFGAWHELAGDLLGAGAPCEDFAIVGGKLYARLKTAEQLAVEERVSSFDKMAVGIQWPHKPAPQEVAKLEHGKSSDPAFGLRVRLWDLDKVPSAAETQAPVRTVRKRKRPEGNALIVLQCMESKFALQAPTMDELFEEVAEQIECPRVGRRPEYFRKAVAKLADTEANKWLWRHAGDRVALTGTLRGGADSEF